MNLYVFWGKEIHFLREKFLRLKMGYLGKCLKVRGIFFRERSEGKCRKGEGKREKEKLKRLCVYNY